MDEEGENSVSNVGSLELLSTIGFEGEYLKTFLASVDFFLFL